MIEIILVLTMWCDPEVPSCTVEKDVLDINVSSMASCQAMATSLPIQLRQSVPGLLSIARCDKHKRQKPKEKE